MGRRRKGPAHQTTASILGREITISHPEKSCHSLPLLEMLKMPPKGPWGAPTGQRSAAAFLFSPAHQQRPQAQHSPSPGQNGARRSRGQAPGQEGLLRHLWGRRGRCRGRHRAEGRHWRGLWESLYLICLSLFKNKLRSSGRGEVGGNACAGGEGGRAGQRPAARKTTPRRSPSARKKAVEHPRGQEAPEPGKSRRRRLRRPLLLPRPPSSAHRWGGGAPRYAGPCSAGDVLATFLGGREERGWDENKAPREQRAARSGPA